MDGLYFLLLEHIACKEGYNEKHDEDEQCEGGGDLLLSSLGVYCIWSVFGPA